MKLSWERWKALPDIKEFISSDTNLKPDIPTTISDLILVSHPGLSDMKTIEKMF